MRSNRVTGKLLPGVGGQSKGFVLLMGCSGTSVVSAEWFWVPSSCSARVLVNPRNLRALDTVCTAAVLQRLEEDNFLRVPAITAHPLHPQTLQLLVLLP